MSVRRRVLFLLPTLTGGGAEQVVVTLLRHLDRARFEPVLAVLSPEGVHRESIPEDVEVIPLNAAGGRVRHSMIRILRLVRRLQPDTVLTTVVHLNLALALLRPLLPARIHVVAREAGVVSKVLESHTLSWLWRWAYRRYYRRFNLIICQSRDMQRDLIENFAVPEAQTRLIHNPVDVARVRAMAAAAPPRASAGPTRLVAVGRLVPQKGFDILLAALALCGDLDWRLSVLGEGPCRNDLLRQVEDLGLSGRVSFPGFKKNPYPEIAQADALVLSSRYEGLPNVVLEALVCGTPVIATPAPGGVREILQGVDGCVIADAISPESLASAIRHWAAGRRAVPSGAAAGFAVEAILPAYEQALAPATDPAHE